jgi:hypothetical protein
MSEFTWYSRLVVWAGALVLLSQAVSGHGPSFMTFLGVLCLTIGFALFLGGLALDGRAPSTVVNSEAPQSGVGEDSQGESAP